MIIKMFVPFNDALKSLISSAVKLTWNEAISLNSREPLQIPFTEFLWILQAKIKSKLREGQNKPG